MKVRYALLLVFLAVANSTIFGQNRASFTASQLDVCVGSSIVFTSNSTVSGSPINYRWNFGSSGSPSIANTAGPHTVVYNTTGIYTVSLTVSGSGGTSIATTLSINVQSPPANPYFDFNLIGATYSDFNTVTGLTRICAPISGFSGMPASIGFTPNTLNTLPSGNFSSSPVGMTLINNSIFLSLSSADLYTVTYSTSGPCPVKTFSRNLLINKLTPGVITGLDTADCNPVVLTYNSDGNIKWLSTTNTGLGYSTITGATILIAPIPTLIKTINTTTYFQTIISSGGCPELIYYKTVTVKGISMVGTATTSSPVICANTTAKMGLNTFFGRIRWKRSTVSPTGPWTYETSFGNNRSSFTTTGISFVGRTYFAADVTYGRNCTTVTSNVITVTSQVCTVTSIIVNTLTSSICQNIGSVIGTRFSSNASFVGIGGISTYLWNFGSGANPATSNSSIPGIVRYNTPGVKTISHTVSGPGAISISTRVITIDGFSTYSSLSSSALSICGGNTVRLTIAGVNLAAVLSWSSSTILGGPYQTIAGLDKSVVTTSSINQNTFFRANITNGACSSINTSALGIMVVPPITISPTTSSTILVCRGNSAVLSVSGQNGSVSWQQSIVSTSGWTGVVGGSGGNTQRYSSPFLTTSGVRFYRASINSPVGCNTLFSGVFVVSVVSCPIQATFNISADELCFSKPVVKPTASITTVLGITVTGINWDFGQFASPSSAIGLFPPDVTFSGVGIQKIGFTVTGNNNSGAEAPFIAEKEVLVYEIPTISGFSTSDGDRFLCAGDSALLFYTPINYIAGVGVNRWYFSTTSGSNYSEFSNSTPTYNTSRLLTTTSFIITSENGICPIFTTTSPITLTVTSLPIISTFTYNSGLPVCNTTSGLAPTLSASNLFGSFSFAPGGLSISPTGQINPTLSSESSYIVTYSIPAAKGCPLVEDTASVTINYKDINPVFNYPLGGVYCNDKGYITPSFSIGFSPNARFSSNSIFVDSFGGINIDSTILTSSHIINYVVNPKAGCPTASGVAMITVTSKPTRPSFSYILKRYCNDELNILPTFTQTSTGGAFTIEPFNGKNISINSLSGIVTVSTITGEDIYNINYIIPAAGGCSQVFANAGFYLFERKPDPIFDYPEPYYCGNQGAAFAQNKLNTNGGFFRDPFSGDLLEVNPTTGSVRVKNTNTNGTFEIQYVIPSNGTCKEIRKSSFINFRSLPLKPVFDYGAFEYCNNLDTLRPIHIEGISNGAFYIASSNKTIAGIKTLTGTLKISSVTGGNLNVIYGVQASGGCGQVNSDTVRLFFNKIPARPIFSYGILPFCNSQRIAILGATNTLGGIYSVLPNNLSINPSNGDLFPVGVPDGVYSITSSISSGNCPIQRGTATITLLSALSVPQYFYTNSPYCQDQTSPALLNSTPTGGFFNPISGLDLNTITGQVNISNSAPGSYNIIFNYQGNNGCGNTVAGVALRIDQKPPQPRFQFEREQYCQLDTRSPVLVNSQSLVNGYFSSSSGLKFVSTVTGAIDPSKSSAGRYIVQYIVPNPNNVCGIILTSTGIEISSPPEKPILSYGNLPYCLFADRDSIIAPVILFNAASATFSGFGITNPNSADLTIPPGKVGQYTISVSIPSGNSCPSVSNTYIITLTSPVSRPTFKYLGSPFCNSDDNFSPTGDPQKGSFSASSSGLIFNNSITGDINLKKSAGGLYTIFYSVPPIDGCPSITVSDTISIVSAKAGIIESEAEKGSLCGGTPISIKISDYKGQLRWLNRKFNQNSWFQADGKMQDFVFNTEKINDSLEFVAIVSYQNCRPDSSNKIKVRVIPRSFGGTIRPIDDQYEICFQLNTQLYLKEQVGTKIQWQFIKGDSTGIKWENLIEGGDYTKDKMKTPNQNEYGSFIYYRAQVTNENCPPDYSNSIRIKVCDKDDFVPNALTPNSGDENSVWLLDQLKLRDFAIVKIFNRYGSIVYEATGRQIREKPFDGLDLPTGVYWYIIDRKNGEKPLTNSLTIIK